MREPQHTCGNDIVQIADAAQQLKPCPVCEGEGYITHCPDTWRICPKCKGNGKAPR